MDPWASYSDSINQVTAARVSPRFELLTIAL
jgi:hypothetical protein